MRRRGIETDPGFQMFEPVAQNPPRLAVLLARTAGRDPLALAPALEAAVRRVDKRAPVYGAAALASKLDGFLAPRRFQTNLLAAFAAMALLMAAAGIYGLVQYSVTTRTREIGIRMAVGAESGAIFRMVLRDGLLLCLAGLAIGIAGALWLGRAASTLLFGIGSSDPLTFAAVSVLLTVVALAACFFPARRAMKLDPVRALRQD
jgi:putative ABC transport system permease protein